MKSLLAALGLLGALLLAALIYQSFRLNAFETQLAAVIADRDATRGELKRLNQQIAELWKRPVTVAAAGNAASGAGKARGAESAPTPSTAPAARPGVTVTAPSGWGKNGAKPEMYVVGVDSTETWGGMPSAYVQSLAPSVEAGFGGMMQTTSAENYVGKRVRLSGWIKTQDANEGGGHLWLRIDGQERGQTLGFDNMDNRAVKGTSDWQEASVVLDVPAGSRALAYGFFVSGGGKMWVNGQRIEEVGPDVPTTNMNVGPPPAPRNLGFNPAPTK